MANPFCGTNQNADSQLITCDSKSQCLTGSGSNRPQKWPREFPAFAVWQTAHSKSVNEHQVDSGTWAINPTTDILSMSNSRNNQRPAQGESEIRKNPSG